LHSEVTVAVFKVGKFPQTVSFGGPHSIGHGLPRAPQIGGTIAIFFFDFLHIIDD